MSSLPTNKFDVSNRVFALLFLSLVGLLGFWSLRIFEIWSTANGTYPAHEITVDATGKSYVTPDVANITLGVHTQAKTSEDAVSQNTTKVNEIMKDLSALGIKKDDIKTVNYYLNPNYQYTDKGQFQDGYILDQSLEVKIKDFQKIGDVIAKTTSTGANMVGGINFTIENRETAKVEARKIAIQNAEIKANQLADQTGLKLDRITNYYEYENAGNGGPIAMSAAAPSAMNSKIAIPPVIEPGQEQINLTVTLTYKLK